MNYQQKLNQWKRRQTEGMSLAQKLRDKLNYLRFSWTLSKMEDPEKEIRKIELQRWLGDILPRD